MIPLARLGYSVTQVHLVPYAQNMNIDEDLMENSRKASSLVACISVSSGSKNKGASNVWKLVTIKLSKELEGCFLDGFQICPLSEKEEEYTCIR